jgi:DNA-binding transcriptional ArsR family regulator
VSRPPDVFSALSDPTRREVLRLLAEDGPASASHLAHQLPVTRQAVSKHLQVLAEAGLVTRTPAGREVRYVASPQALAEVVEWVAQVGGRWDRRLARLSDLLGR